MDPAAVALGDFLRARRSGLRPEDVGLVSVGGRRVSGLRREEVAHRAGISPDYYTRLEQGRGHRPSEQVLDAVAAALALDRPATAHLRRLARGGPVRRSRPAEVPSGIRHLLDDLDGRVSAFVQDPLGEVLAANTLAGALSPSFTTGSNTLRAAFLDPALRSLYPAWTEVAAEAVAGLRAAAGSELIDARLHDLVAELSASSEEFRVLWERHEVVPKVGGPRVPRRHASRARDASQSRSALTGSTAYLATPARSSRRWSTTTASLLSSK